MIPSESSDSLSAWVSTFLVASRPEDSRGVASRDGIGLLLGRVLGVAAGLFQCLDKDTRVLGPPCSAKNLSRDLRTEDLFFAAAASFSSFFCNDSSHTGGIARPILLTFYSRYDSSLLGVTESLLTGSRKGSLQSGEMSPEAAAQSIMLFGG